MRHDRRRSRPLRFDALEGKLLLSTASRPRPAATTSSLILDGQYKVTSPDLSRGEGLVGDLPGDAPITVRLPVTGRGRSMGPVVGQIVETIDAKSMSATAEMVLTNAKGSVRLTFSLDHPTLIRSGGRPVGTRVRFVVASGDGAYARASGAGTITAAVGDSSQARNNTTIRTTRP